jgi:hypothetical protein
MHDRSFITGFKLGEYLTRLTRVEAGLEKVERKVDDLAGKIRRGAILAALWTFALLANASTDRAAEFAVEIVRTAWKR